MKAKAVALMTKSQVLTGVISQVSCTHCFFKEVITIHTFIKC